MFGYITPVQGELTVNDFNTFKRYYCGLCLCIKERFGHLPRIFLNYDATFFAVLLDGLSNDSPTIQSTNCIRHPFSTRDYILNNQALNYAADLNISLTYYKLLDNVLDDKDLKSLTSSKMLKHYYNKVLNDKLKNTIHSSLSDLHKLEKSSNNYELDTICHPFSKITAEILKNYPGTINDDSEKVRNHLYNFGYSFGKWIYLIDALDDLKEDIECNSFNPLEKVYNNNFTYSELIESIKENLDFILLNLINNCSNLIKKIPLHKNESIIKNVVNLGLVDKYMNILDKI